MLSDPRLTRTTLIFIRRFNWGTYIHQTSLSIFPRCPESKALYLYSPVLVRMFSRSDEKFSNFLALKYDLLTEWPFAPSRPQYYFTTRPQFHPKNRHFITKFRWISMTRARISIHATTPLSSCLSIFFPNFFSRVACRSKFSARTQLIQLRNPLFSAISLRAADDLHNSPGESQSAPRLLHCRCCGAILRNYAPAGDLCFMLYGLAQINF